MVVLYGWVCAVGCLATHKSRDRGESLFFGREPLRGAIRGHRASLPPEVLGCGNCHAVPSQAQTVSALAPRIDRSLLLEAHQRRAGPPSIYDVVSFCKLLRTGIDPAYVLIAREMPAYDVDDAQCMSLWQFLTDNSTTR